MGFLVALASKLGTWVLEKAGVWLIGYIKTRAKINKRHKIVDLDVTRVEELVAEMKAKRKAKIPIPPKLKKDLKDAMARLNTKPNGG